VILRCILSICMTGLHVTVKMTHRLNMIGSVFDRRNVAHVLAQFFGLEDPPHNFA